MRLTPLALLAVTVAVTPVAGGPLAYAACQTGMLKIPPRDLRPAVRPPSVSVLF